MKDDDTAGPDAHHYVRDDSTCTLLKAVAGVNIATDDGVTLRFDGFHVSSAEAKSRKPEIFLVGRRLFF
jgi:hypothetical protein